MYISVIRNAVYIVSIRRVIRGAYNMCILVYNMCITNEYTCYTVLYNCVFPQCIQILNVGIVHTTYAQHSIFGLRKAAFLRHIYTFTECALLIRFCLAVGPVMFKQTIYANFPMLPLWSEFSDNIFSLLITCTNWTLNKRSLIAHPNTAKDNNSLCISQ